MRRGAAIVLVAMTAGLAGCAVGRFIAGAPSQREGTAATTSLLARRCSGCHAIPDPASMPAAKWQDGLDRMKRRLQLPAAEWDSLQAMARRP